MPPIDTVLIDAPEIAAQGCGEPAIVPLGAAVANAIYDAVGVRFTEMPVTPEKVLAALDAARATAGPGGPGRSAGAAPRRGAAGAGRGARAAKKA